MPQLEHIEEIEKRLWEAADSLRANSNYASNEYFLPVMGLIFLRHAYSRFLRVKKEIEPTLPSRGGVTRALRKEDFSSQSAIFLQEKAQFDYLVGLPDSTDRAKAVVDAMESIEEDYESLRGILPKKEYQELDNEVLGQLLRKLNPDALKKVSGDVFGRIYEYFLTQFADQKAHDGGEFFTPISLVSLIAHIIDPQKGLLLDPASGSGGMFVQSAKIVEEHGQNPTDKLTFKGLEKNGTTIQLAKMNLAVHGLTGDIQKAITYYEDPQDMLAKADYVMANPPFNVDEIDAKKVETDPRLPFGLPGVNKNNRISNGNYVWMSYFYSYLNDSGKAGFVMSSQASSARNDEAAVRQKMIETGDVDIMVSIRSNFFYTRSVPCELWFFNKAKPEAMRDKVLMIDARNIYRQVTRRIYDFSPEQEKNILALVWLYRGEQDKYLNLLDEYCQSVLEETNSCFSFTDEEGTEKKLFTDFTDTLKKVYAEVEFLLDALEDEEKPNDLLKKYDEAKTSYAKEVKQFEQQYEEARQAYAAVSMDNDALAAHIEGLKAMAGQSRTLVKQVNVVYKLLGKLADACKALDEKHEIGSWKNRTVNRKKKKVDGVRKALNDQLKQVRYFWKQAHWLSSRFPEGELQDVEGLVKLVDRAEIEENDWSLTPGRYVGVAPEEEDEDFDFEETIRNIHLELEGLNEEATKLAETIQTNFEELGG
jgi:type I restriction enzyme M protein